MLQLLLFLQLQLSDISISYVMEKGEAKNS